MGDHAAIQLALETAGITTAISRVQNLSGGCIHTVVAVTLADGASVVAKINDPGSERLFEEESQSLRALRKTGAVLTPEPFLTGVFADRAVLLMSRLKPAREHTTEEHWRQFGRELAALHSADAGSRYGFDQDNHIGSTPQPNSWQGDWVEFNAVNRLGYQITIARDSHVLEVSEVRTLEAVIDRLEQYIPRRPRASLLHGDLWSGNAIPALDKSGKARIAVIDPACSIGDGWADIAMMRLFGGFPRACFDSYEQFIKRPDDVESRLAVYTLYHVLNHVNIFGRGYISQALSLTAQLTGSRR